MENGWKSKRIAVIGLGSGGSAVADMLARMGVGKLILVDPDNLEGGNLSRHVLTDRCVGWKKVHAMEEHLRYRVGLEVIPIDKKFGRLPFKPDLIASCVDSLACESLINAYSLENNVPAVYGGVHGDARTAEVITVIPGSTPCYECYEREGPLPEPGQEAYTNPGYDKTKMPHQEGLWCDVLMAASIQFRAILEVLRYQGCIEGLKKSKSIYGCFGELLDGVHPLILASLRPPYGAEIVRQKRGCAICTDDMEELRV